MKKILASMLASFVLLFVLFVPQASAKIITSEGGEVSIAKGEVVNDDLFVGAQSVAIDGTVNGDVFIGAQTVKISGVINGNLHVGAQTISINGDVKGNVYIGGQSLSITSSNITGSIISGLQNLNIDNETLVGGSIITGGASVNVNTQIKRNLIVGAGILTIGDSTKIGKDLYYATGSEAGQTSISEKAVIGGEIHKADTAPAQAKVEKAQEDASMVFAKAKVAGGIFSFIGALVIGLLALKLFGPFIANASATIKTSFWKSLGVGFLIMIGFFPAVIVLLLTVLGIPLIGIVILLLILYGYMAKIVFADAVGSLLKEKTKLKTGKYITFTLGLILVYLIKLIPVVGVIFGAIVFWVGLGAITINIFKKEK